MARVPAREQPPIAAFCLDKTEVTVRDYARCVDAGECKEPTFDEILHTELATWAEPRQWEMPVNFVGAEHVTSFCRFIGGRLPTYEEWMWAWDRLSYDRYHAAPEKYRPQGRQDVFPQPATKPCSEPGDIVGDGICNLGGGWYEWVEEPRHEAGLQFSWTGQRLAPPASEADARERRGPGPGGPGSQPEPLPWYTFRCAR